MGVGVLVGLTLELTLLLLYMRELFLPRLLLVGLLFLLTRGHGCVNQEERLHSRLKDEDSMMIRSLGEVFQGVGKCVPQRAENQLVRERLESVHQLPLLRLHLHGGGLAFLGRLSFFGLLRLLLFTFSLLLGLLLRLLCPTS